MKRNILFSTILQSSQWFIILAMLFSLLGINPVKAAPAGTALQFNGTSQYATLGSATQLRSATFTVELWLKRTGAGVGTGTGSGGITSAIPLITKGRAEAETAAADINYFFGIDATTGRLVADFEEAQVAQGGTTPGLNHPITGTAVISADGAWHHAAATYDGTTWNLYLDGVLDGTLVVGRPANALTNTLTSVGSARTTGGVAAGFLAGVVDEVRIWSVARSQTQINADKNIEITSPQPNLLGVWNLNEGTGGSLADSSGNVVTGATVGGQTWVTGFPDPTSPASPANLAASTLGQTVNLTWTANSETDLAGYNVYRSTSPSVPLTGPINGGTPVVGPSYADGGRSNGIQYYYVVTAVDTSGNQSTASNEVSVTPLASSGSALQFDGTNDYVTFGSASGLGVTSFTIETWFKRTGTGAGTTTGSGGIASAIPLVTKGRAEAEGSNVDMNYFLGIDASTNKLVADFEEGAGGPGPLGQNHPITGTTTIGVDNTWHHTAVTYNTTTREYKVYLDGNLEVTQTLAAGVAPRSDSIQHAALGTAMNSTGVPLGFFAGVLDESRVWNTARTQAEIQSTKNSEITSGTGLVARWGMNEGSGTTTNSSVGSFPGNLTNGPIWVSGFVPPPVNQAPNAPTVNAPANGATGVGASPTLDVSVSDPNSGDPLTVTFFGRPYASGVFTQIAQNTSVASGSSTTTSWASLGAGQEFEWYVTVSDGALITTGATWIFHTAPSADPVFVGAGDIAECSITDDTATGNIIQGIAGTVFTTGDNVYPNGTAADFTNCYASTPWGSPSVLSRTRPVPGNHDWGTGVTENLDGYFGYYGANANQGGTSYYSYDIDANWHVVNLDSECQLVPGGCGVGSPQEVWLKADLAANAGKNVIAEWHKPRYSSGATNYQTLQPLWDALYDAGVDILLDGHDHIYERTAPMKSGATLSDPPVADPLYGIRQFTIGTGGEGHHGLATALPTSDIRNDTTFGIFKLTLHATTYDWTFLPIAGSTFTDSGTGTVHGAPPVCYALTLGHTGNGSTPTASLANSTGCPASEYVSGEVIGLGGTAPAAGWQVDSWYGTGNDASTADTNSLTMPANAHAAGVNYTTIPGAGAALQFDGGNDYVTFGPAPSLGAATFTLETWFKRTGAGVGTNTGSGGIASAIPLVTKGRAEAEGSSVDMNYFLGIDSASGVLVADFEDMATGANHPVTGVTAISSNVWHHAAATYDGTTWKLYLDGVLDTQLAVGQSPRSDSIQHAALGTAMNSTGVAAGFFQGTLDEARIWNVARTQTEIQNSINSELTSGTGLIGRWGMNEGSGTTIADSTAPAADGTLTNGTVWVTPGAPFNLDFNQAPVVNAGADQTVPLLDNLELSGSVSDDGLPFPPGTVTVTWSKVSGPGTVSFLNASASSTTASFSANGTYVLRLTADDSALTASDDVTITIAPVVNNGLDLGGTASGAYVTFGDPAKLDLAQFTIETWFKRTGTGVSNTTGTSGILNAIPLVTHGAPEGDGSSIDANWILAINDSTDVIAADFEDTATGLNHPVVGTTTITDNVWHHAAATYDGTTWRLYLDGNLEATLAANATPRSDSIQQSGLGAMITSTGSALGRFQGTLDETRVWNRALTLAEIRANINSEVSSGSGLVARWGLNETSGSSVGDSVPSSATGTVNGTNYAWVTGAPFNILINNPPNTPVLNLPANNATGVSTSPTLDAAVSDPDGGNLNVSFYGRPSSGLPAAGADFTIIALPDTQYYTSSLNGGSPAIFNSQTNWIVDNIDSRNIVFVTQLGDCTEHGDTYEIEWQNADTAFQTIENPTTTGMTFGMPYGIAPGNHDQSPIGNANGTTTFYNQYFGEARFLGRDYYGGHYGANNDNHYELFSVSGLDFIVIHLEYDTAANASVLDWADALLKTYSDRRGIVVSHYIINAGFNASFGTQGQAIYTALKDNPNLFLMLSGHVSPPEGQRSDTYQGNTINTLMSDYQGRTNGGNGWLRIMTFSPTNNTVQVQTYSPWLNQFETDADSQFTLAYNMQDDAAPFTVVGTTTVASGSNATVSWSGLTAGTQYEWYATVSDGSATATSSTNAFTTAAQTYTLATSTVGNGTVTKSPDQASYNAGGIVTLTANPAAGSTFTGWSGDASGSTNPLNITMDGNKSITATFAINTFTLNYAAGTGGTLTGVTSQTVNYGEDGTPVEAVPNTGYHFVDWSDGSTANPRTDTNVTANASVTANFAVDTFTLNYAAGTGGTLTGDTAQTVNYGEDGTSVTAVPNTGYHFVNWSDSSTANPRTDTNATANVSVTANFAINTFSLNYTAGVGGTLTGNTSQTVNYGADGTSVTAVPNTGYHFVSWSDGVLTATRTDQNVTANLSVTANFAQNTFTLDVTVDGSGTVMKNPDQATYLSGSTVELIATAAPGWTFAGWSGDASGSTNPLDVTMDGNKSITATFTQITYTLDVTIIGNGAISKNPDSASYFIGSVVELTGTAAPGWTFSGWSGDASGSTNPLNVTMDGNKSITATFTQNTYTLDVAVIGNGTVTRDNDGPYHFNDEVILTATPDLGWTFSGWSGDASGSANQVTVTIDGDKSVNATFVQSEYTLTVNTTGNGTVTRSVDGPYHLNDQVTLTAIPATGWTFSGWSGSGCSGTGTCIVTMDDHKTVTAVFAAIEYALTVNITGNGAVTRNPDQATYHYGDIVELTAAAGSGWTFDSWGGALSGNTNPQYVTVNGDTMASATFTQNFYTLAVTVLGSGTVSKSPDQPNYLSGSVVQLTATAAPGWTFSGWSGDASGNTNPLSVAMDGNKSITATFTEITYTLNVTIVGNGTVAKNPDQAAYSSGSTVELTAAAAPGWQFSGWSGDASGSTNPLNVTMNGNTSITTTFTVIPPTCYPLTLSHTGQGSSPTASPANSAGCSSGQYVAGASINLSGAVPTAGWQINGWTGTNNNASTASTNSVTIPAGAHTASVSYTQIEYTLTVNLVGSGSVVKSPNQPTYHYGDIVQLTATPSSGWIFTSWSGDASGSTNPVSVTMNGNKTVTATFALNDLIFKDGFNSCNASAWTSINATALSFPAQGKTGCGMQVNISSNSASYVRDNTPNLETRYRARFYFNPNGIVMGKNDSHVIFGAYTAQSTNTLVIEFRKNGSSFQIRAGLLNDRGKWSYTGWTTLPTPPNSWSAIELDWRAATAAGANNGGLTLWLNGTQVANLTGIDNDLQKVDWIALGAVNAIDSGTRGTYYFDEFESRRSNYIGP